MYYFNNLIGAPCAWQDCGAQCAVEWDENGSLKYLPSCFKHRPLIAECHHLYKRVGEIYHDVNLDRFQSDEKKKILQIKAEALMLEAKQRIELASRIKDVYRDEGHAYYINYLIEQANQTVQQIKGLK